GVQGEPALLDASRALRGARPGEPHLREEMTMTEPKGLSTLKARPLRAIVIGGSAGGIEAVNVLLAALPRPLLVPVLVVLHIAAGSRTHWPVVFRGSSAPVFEAEDKDVAEPGNVYVAPPDYHLLVDDGARLSLAADERVHLARPSIDVLFESAAWSFGSAVLG